MTLLLIVFALTLGAGLGGYLLVVRAVQRRDTARLRARVGSLTERTKEQAKAAQQLFWSDDDGRPWWGRLFGKLNPDRAIEQLTDQAGVSWPSGQVALACLLLMLAAVNFWWYTAPPELRKLAFVVAPPVGALPILMLRWKRTRRIAAFEAQFPDALQFIARAMRAGHAFSVSLEMLHKEFANPLGAEFRKTFEEQNLGLPVDIALEKLARRMPLLDVQFFVAAVVLQKRTGGNLAEILDNLSKLIRERFKLRGQIRSISAHGRLSSAVLTAIPIGVAILMYFVNREHMLYFAREEFGQWMAGAAIGLAILGYFIMRQIVKIEV